MTCNDSRIWEALEGHWHSGQAVWPERDAPALLPAVRDLPLLETLAGLVRRHGSRPAVQDDRWRLSFTDVWDGMAGLARMIETADAPPGPVAVMLPADSFYLSAVLACIAAGRPAVLLDAAMPQARAEMMLRQTGAALLLLPEQGLSFDLGGVMALRAGWTSNPDAIWPDSFPSALPPDAPAVILCTSGSTGQPKAIVHSQSTMMQRAWCHANLSGAGPGDLCLSFSPPTILGGINGLLSFAIAGGATRLFDLRSRGVFGLIEVLSTEPVTAVRAPVSVLRVLPDLPDAKHVLRRLRNLTTYGEPVLRQDVAALRGCIPATAGITATFGSTESGGMGWHPSADDAYHSTRTPAGWLMPGMDAIVLDEHDRPCAPDHPGELVVRSRYNALGEWRDGRCVSAALLPDPIDPTRRIHRTGDLARRAPDGVFTVLDRLDRMVKINGQRIEPAEVEAAVRRLPGVADCAVGLQRRGAVVYLAAFVVLQPTIPPEAADGFRSMLATVLPRAMVPARFVVLPQLPRLPGGKVDYLALAA